MKNEKTFKVFTKLKSFSCSSSSPLVYSFFLLAEARQVDFFGLQTTWSLVEKITHKIINFNQTNQTKMKTKWKLNEMKGNHESLMVVSVVLLLFRQENVFKFHLLNGNSKEFQFFATLFPSFFLRFRLRAKQVGCRQENFSGPHGMQHVYEYTSRLLLLFFFEKCCKTWCFRPRNEQQSLWKFLQEFRRNDKARIFETLLKWHGIPSLIALTIVCKTAVKAS